MSYILEYEPKSEETYHSFTAVTFPENLPPSSFFSQDSSSLTPESNQINFNLYGQKDKRIMKAENEKFEYIGKNFGENSEKNQENKYLIGVLSDSKKRMKLYDIDHIFNMKQTKKIKPENEDFSQVVNLSSKMNALEQKQMLVAEFGTKKSKRKLQQMLSNIVEV